MKIQQGKLDTFINQIVNSNIISCLLYGHDYGIKSITSEAIISAILKKEPERVVVTLNSDSVQANPNILYEECFNIGLLSEKKIIKIRDVGNELFAIISTVIENIGDNTDTLLILLCDQNVDTNSKLVSLYEKKDKLAGIGCYSDDISTAISVIQRFFKNRGINCNNDVINVIAGNLRGDRMLLLSELEKLLLYIGDTKHVTMDIVELSMTDLSYISLDSLIDAIALKERTTAVTEFKRAIQEDFSVIAIVRILSGHFIKLRTALYNIKGGSTIQDEAKGGKIFFKRLGAFKRQIETWNIRNVELMITTLFNLEADLKKYPENVGKLMTLNVIITC